MTSLLDQIPDSKTWYKSKTFYAAIAMAVLPALPPVAVFAAANPVLYSAIWSAIFGGLRVSTTKPVTLVKPKIEGVKIDLK